MISVVPPSVRRSGSFVLGRIEVRSIRAGFIHLVDGEAIAAWVLEAVSFTIRRPEGTGGLLPSTLFQVAGCRRQVRHSKNWLAAWSMSVVSDEKERTCAETKGRYSRSEAIEFPDFLGAENVCIVFNVVVVIGGNNVHVVDAQEGQRIVYGDRRGLHQCSL